MVVVQWWRGARKRRGSGAEYDVYRQPSRKSKCEWLYRQENERGCSSVRKDKLFELDGACGRARGVRLIVDFHPFPKK